MTRSSDTQSLPRFRPLYVQIKELLMQRLTSGEWRPGMLLPSEQSLAAEFGVSQGTLRKALEELAADKLLVRQQGKGTRVAEHDPRSSLFQFFRIQSRKGEPQMPNSRYLSIERTAADPLVAASLGLRAGTNVIRLRRVRDLSGVTILTENIALPAKLFPGLDKTLDELPNTLYSMYQHRYGITVGRAIEQLAAVAATGNDARDLNIEVGTPLLEISRRALDIGGRAVEWRVSRCLTRDYHYLSELN